MLTTAVISILLCLCSLGTAQVDFRTCGDENSDVTCSFFFGAVDGAFRQPSVLYTLRKAFFPSEGRPPFLFDVEMTLEIENIPVTSPQNFLSCRDEPIGSLSVNSPPPMGIACDSTIGSMCEPLRIGWTHQWSKTIVSYIIEREDLELLQDTNFVAYAAATFNNFDTSVFSNDDLDLEPQDAVNASAAPETSGVGATREKTVEFQLSIPYLPCRPDDGVLLDAWEDILPWVSLPCSSSMQHTHIAKHSIIYRTPPCLLLYAV